jgi:hypothetical protein
LQLTADVEVWPAQAPATLRFAIATGPDCAADVACLCSHKIEFSNLKFNGPPAQPAYIRDDNDLPNKKLVGPWPDGVALDASGQKHSATRRQLIPVPVPTCTNAME